MSRGNIYGNRVTLLNEGSERANSDIARILMNACLTFLTLLQKFRQR